MKIEQIELRVVRMELVRPFATSSSRKTCLEHILIRAQAGGLVGWGECASPSGPYYCEETTGTCWHILKEFLIPKTIGIRWSSIEELSALFRGIKRNYFARAGLEMACWDLLAQRRNEPLYQTLGGGVHNPILSGVSLGIEEDPTRLFDLIERYTAEGYRRVKLKIGPGQDIVPLAAVRERFPDLPLMADANSAYTLRDIPLLRELDQFGLIMIEQPLAHDDIIDHARLQRELQTPICLDESILSAEDARKAIDLESCRIINIKVSRVGGLLAARKVHDECLKRNIPVWCGGMHEYGIGRAANVALSSLPGFTLPGDVSGSDKYFAEDLVNPPIRAIDGSIELPTEPGLGWAPDMERITRRTTHIETFS